ncbi:HAMP domain-containing sensor histidine kinase [Chakrabartyella piscis]|uniref:sensor histidine kinase n=1 Tax=Chakrabartyella piscis TaxID=2918914 RepID=UPI0029588853|nr:HAMP domain-containing sensor histidine kinase [Chakrabartyella piscis]
MVSIQNKISKPFFILIIAIPLSIFILFNLLVYTYTYMESKANLEEAGILLEQSIQSNQSQSSIKAKNNEIGLMQLSMSSSKLENTELLIFDQLGQLSDLKEYDLDFLDDAILEKAYAKTSLEAGAISFSQGFQNYHAMQIDVGNKLTVDKVVYITSGQISSSFILALNGILFLVSLVVLSVFLPLSRKISTQITKPITDIVSTLDAYQANELVLLPENKSSLEIHILTQKINELNRSIYQYNNAQKTFLHNASHELRTPLMNIQGYADGIAMGIFEDAKGTAHLISDQTKHLTSLVDGLLTLARVEGFDKKKRLSKQNIGDFLNEFLSSYAGYAQTQNIHVSLSIAENAYCLANEELLSGAIGNVMSNAIRYAKKEVSLSLHKTRNKMMLKIKDDGDGISNINQIFERFQKGKGGNFGLGLSIAKTSVEMMNGTLTAYNDDGAVFEITLPLASDLI